MSNEIANQLLARIQDEMERNIITIKKQLAEWLERPESGGLNIFCEQLNEVSGGLALLGRTAAATLSDSIANAVRNLDNAFKTKSIADTQFSQKGSEIASALLLLHDYIEHISDKNAIDEKEITETITVINTIAKGHEGIIAVEPKIDRETYQALSEKVTEVIEDSRNKIEQFATQKDKTFDADTLIGHNKNLISLFEVLNLKAPQLLLEQINKMLKEQLSESQWIDIAEAMILVEETLKQIQQDSNNHIGSIKDAVQQQSVHSRSLEVQKLIKNTGEIARKFFESVRKLLSHDNKLTVEQPWHEAALRASHYSAVAQLVNEPMLAQALSRLSQIFAELSLQRNFDPNAFTPVADVLVGVEYIFTDLADTAQTNINDIKFLNDAILRIARIYKPSPQSSEILKTFITAEPKSDVNNEENKANVEDFEDLLSNLNALDEDFDGQEITPEETPKEEDLKEELSDISSAINIVTHHSGSDILTEIDNANETTESGLFFANKSFDELQHISVPADKLNFTESHEAAVMDDEIRSFFIEELDEKIDEIQSEMDNWLLNPQDKEHIGVVRRAFHTIKGSGRTVGYEALGECAWQHEQMLNRVLDNTFPVHKVMQETIADTIAMLRLLRAGDDFKEEKGALLTQAYLVEKLTNKLIETPDEKNTELQKFLENSRKSILASDEAYNNEENQVSSETKAISSADSEQGIFDSSQHTSDAQEKISEEVEAFHQASVSSHADSISLVEEMGEHLIDNNLSIEHQPSRFEEETAHQDKSDEMTHSVEFESIPDFDLADNNLIDSTKEIESEQKAEITSQFDKEIDDTSDFIDFSSELESKTQIDDSHNEDGKNSKEISKQTVLPNQSVSTEDIDSTHKNVDSLATTLANLLAQTMQDDISEESLDHITSQIEESLAEHMQNASAEDFDALSQKISTHLHEELSAEEVSELLQDMTIKSGTSSSSLAEQSLDLSQNNAAVIETPVEANLENSTEEASLPSDIDAVALTLSHLLRSSLDENASEAEIDDIVQQLEAEVAKHAVNLASNDFDHLCQQISDYLANELSLAEVKEILHDMQAKLQSQSLSTSNLQDIEYTSDAAISAATEMVELPTIEQDEMQHSVSTEDKDVQSNYQHMADLLARSMQMQPVDEEEKQILASAFKQTLQAMGKDALTESSLPQLRQNLEKYTEKDIVQSEDYQMLLDNILSRVQSSTSSSILQDTNTLEDSNLSKEEHFLSSASATQTYQQIAQVLQYSINNQPLIPEEERIIANTIRTQLQDMGVSLDDIGQLGEIQEKVAKELVQQGIQASDYQPLLEKVLSNVVEEASAPILDKAQVQRLAMMAQQLSDEVDNTNIEILANELRHSLSSDLTSSDMRAMIAEQLKEMIGQNSAAQELLSDSLNYLDKQSNVNLSNTTAEASILDSIDDLSHISSIDGDLQQVHAGISASPEVDTDAESALSSHSESIVADDAENLLATSAEAQNKAEDIAIEANHKHLSQHVDTSASVSKERSSHTGFSTDYKGAADNVTDAENVLSAYSKDIEVDIAEDLSEASIEAQNKVASITSEAKHEHLSQHVDTSASVSKEQPAHAGLSTDDKGAADSVNDAENVLSSYSKDIEVDVAEDLSEISAKAQSKAEITADDVTHEQSVVSSYDDIPASKTAQLQHHDVELSDIHNEITEVVADKESTIASIDTSGIDASESLFENNDEWLAQQETSVSPTIDAEVSAREIESNIQDGIISTINEKMTGVTPQGEMSITDADMPIMAEPRLSHSDDASSTVQSVSSSGQYSPSLSSANKLNSAKNRLNEELSNIAQHPTLQDAVKGEDDASAENNKVVGFLSAVDQFELLSKQLEEENNPDLIDNLIDSVYDIEDTLDPSQAPDWIWRMLDAIEQLLLSYKVEGAAISLSAASILRQSVDLIEHHQDLETEEEATQTINSLLNARQEVAGYHPSINLVESPIITHIENQHNWDEWVKDPNAGTELVETFLDEAVALLGRSQLEAERWDNNRDQITHLDTIRRDMHTLKGSARMAGYFAIGDLTHAVESMIESIVDGHSEASSQAAAILSGAMWQGMIMLDAIRDGYLPQTDPYMLNNINRYLGLPLPYPEVAENELRMKGKGQATDEQPKERVDSTQAQPVAEPSEIPSEEAIDETVETPAHEVQQSLPTHHFDENIDPVLVDIFSDEAQELIEQAGILLDEDLKSPEVIEELKRNMHTLKGGARLVGMKPIGDTSHLMESVIEKIPDYNDTKTRQAKNLLHIGHDALYDMLDSILRQEMPMPADAVNESLNVFVQQGRYVLPEQGHNQAEQTAESNAESAYSTAVENAEVANNISKAAQPEEIKATPEAIAEPTEVQTANIGAQEVNTIAENAQEDTVVETSADIAEKATEAEKSPSEEKQPDQSAMLKSPSELSAKEVATEVAPVEVQRYVRVDAKLLDEMIAMIGETAIVRSRMENLSAKSEFNLNELTRIATRIDGQMRRLDNETEAQMLFRRESQQQDDEHFDPLEMDRFSEIQQLSRQLAEAIDDLKNVQDTLAHENLLMRNLSMQQAAIQRGIQDRLLTTQLIRFETNEARLRRLVRQTAKTMGKDVNFILEGGEVELERRLIEDVLPAIEHMIRNAISHGIESEELRVAAGKPAQGTVKLSIAAKASNVEIRLLDDGRGFDYDKIRQKAEEKGWLDASRADDPQYLMSLMMRSGFSTASTVTQISGRGVGMDVVNEMVKQRRGQITADSIPGKGAQFTILMPFSMSIAEVLLVEIAGQTYAAPMNAIAAVHQIDHEILERSHKGEEIYYHYDGMDYRVYVLGDYFKPQDYEFVLENATAPALFINAGGEPVALYIDRISNRLEIIVKNVNRQVLNIPGISGATILGDGHVVPVLELLDLSRRIAGLANFETEVIVEEEIQTRNILVVDDSVTMRKVSTRLLERNGYIVQTAKDGLDAIDVLASFTPDLILLDIEMPRMDGFEFANHVRQHTEISTVPIVMVTSRTGDKHRGRAEAIGVQGYLGKPYREDILIETLEKLLGEHANG